MIRKVIKTVKEDYCEDYCQAGPPLLFSQSSRGLLVLMIEKMIRGVKTQNGKKCENLLKSA
jgi:hypothetical protein